MAKRMSQTVRRQRIDYLERTLRRHRAEYGKGFVDCVCDGRVIATAAEIERSAGHIIGQICADLERLREGLR